LKKRSGLTSGGPSRPAPGITIQDVWGATKLERLLYEERNRGLKESFFKEEHLTQIREMHAVLLRLVPDILERLRDGTAAAAREIEAQTRQAECVCDFQESLRSSFCGRIAPAPLKLSDLQKARRAGDRVRATALEDAAKLPGCWEVMIYPGKVPEQPRVQTLSECRSIVEACQVNADGRYSPKTSHEGHESGHDWFGQTPPYTNIPESWQISQRGEFVQASVVMDDLLHPPQLDYSWGSLKPHGFEPRKFLDIDVAVHLVTRMFRFAAKLSARAFDPNEEAVKIAMTLTRTKGRVLITRDDPGRMMGWYISSAKELENTWSLRREELCADPDGHAVRALVWFFERFNWPRVTGDLIASNQVGQFSRR
jgi:hypothetical protein